MKQTQNTEIKIMEKAKPEWTGNFTPKMHQRVRVKVNSLGFGRITGFFDECGWKGVIVTLEDAPEWHKRQRNNDPRSWVFGREIELVD
jgi:hypothetical protein